MSPSLPGDSTEIFPKSAQARLRRRKHLPSSPGLQPVQRAPSSAGELVPRPDGGRVERRQRRHQEPRPLLLRLQRDEPRPLRRLRRDAHHLRQVVVVVAAVVAAVVAVAAVVVAVAAVAAAVPVWVDAAAVVAAALVTVVTRTSAIVPH